MKFAYIDESGGAEHTDVFVMAGIVIDASKLRKCTADFDALLTELKNKHPSPNKIKEIKTSSMINGKDDWSEISPETRKNYITSVIELIKQNSGKIPAFAISFELFKNATDNSGNLNLPHAQDKYWVAASMYICAIIQKKCQSKARNKGLSVLIFDENKRYMTKLSNNLYELNGWFDALYSSKILKKEKRFDQIINTAFFIQSEHSSLIQVADIICYLYRRNLELMNSDEKYKGEKNLYSNWCSMLDEERLRIKSHKNSKNETIKFYQDIKHPKWEF